MKNFAKLPLAALALLTAACGVSHNDIKLRDVSQSFVVNDVSSEQLSECTLVSLRGLNESVVDRNYDALVKKWFIMAQAKIWPGGASGSFKYSMSFSDVNDDSLIEIRSRDTVFGSPMAPVEKITEFTNTCRTALLSD